MTDQPVPDCFPVRACGPIDGERGGQLRDAQTIPERQRLPIQDTGQQVEGWRQVRTTEPGHFAAWHHERHLQRLLEPYIRAGADPIEKAERVAVATEENMLAVVDELPCRAILKCGCSAAEARPRLEDEHAGPALRERRRRAETRTTGANHDDVEGALAQ